MKAKDSRYIDLYRVVSNIWIPQKFPWRMTSSFSVLTWHTHWFCARVRFTGKVRFPTRKSCSLAICEVSVFHYFLLPVKIMIVAVLNEETRFPCSEAHHQNGDVQKWGIYPQIFFNGESDDFILHIFSPSSFCWLFPPRSDRSSFPHPGSSGSMNLRSQHLGRDR